MEINFKGFFFHKKRNIFKKKMYFQVLCNALWYVTNHHETIQEASKTGKVEVIPPPFNSENLKTKITPRRKKLSSRN